MIFGIFSLNWILIDIIIIFLLILFLLGVKIFKGLSRWRFSLSHESLIKSNYKKDIKIYYNKSAMIIKILNLTQNSKFSEEALKRPSIIIIRTNRKKKLAKILTEGLSSYGFNIINTYLKNFHNSFRILLNSKNNNENEIYSSKILKIIAQDNKTLNNKYVIINYGKSYLSFKPILSDIDNIGLILINPRIDKLSIKNLLAIKDINLSKNNLHLVFSYYLNFYFKNPNLKRFKSRLIPLNKELFNFITLEKASSSFKYYETILISKIIFLIKKMNNNFRTKR